MMEEILYLHIVIFVIRRQNFVFSVSIFSEVITTDVLKTICSETFRKGWKKATASEFFLVKMLSEALSSKLSEIFQKVCENML